MVDSINSLNEFWDYFKLPISMSLIGAIIGHYRKNGVIQWPIFNIAYEKGPFFENKSGIMKIIRCIYLFFDFIFYIIGIHIGKKREPVSFDLGYFGDLLVGIGAGIIAKCIIEVGDVENQFALISSSLLAGFAGMSYMLAFQRKEEEKWESETNFALNNTEVDLGRERSESTNTESPEDES